MCCNLRPPDVAPEYEVPNVTEWAYQMSTKFYRTGDEKVPNLFSILDLSPFSIGLVSK